jgi:hypothetical protein
MDGARFDRFTRLVTRPMTRRASLGMAAGLAGLGIVPRGTDARKKRKSGCKGGCGICQVCKKQGKRKKCVTAQDGAACDGGVCQAGACRCVPATCASRSTVCGTASDGCGGTLSCGTCGDGESPACRDGICEDCAYACRARCSYCFHKPDGTTLCGDDADFACDSPCESDASCPADRPTCVASYTARLTNVTTRASVLCSQPVTGLCVTIAPCLP